VAPTRRAAVLYDLALEEGLLGSMMLSAEVCAKALEALTTEDFGSERTRCLFGVVRELGSDVDALRVSRKARERWPGDPGDVAPYVHTLVHEVASPRHGLALVEDMLQVRARRQALDASELLAKAAESEDPEVVLHLARTLVAPEPSRNGWRRMSAAQLLSAVYEEPRWLVPDILPEGLCMFAARPKTGKSWLLLELAVALATGGRFLGHHLERAPVLILALEDGDRRLAKRLQALECPHSVEGLHFQFGMPPLGDGGLEYLTQLVDEIQPALVGIDTVSRALGARTDQDKNADMTAALGPLQQLALERHLCMMLVDHLRKPDGPMSDKNPITEVMGSTAKVGVADTIWGLYRKKGERRGELSITGRDLEDAELVLDFETMPRAWQLVGSAEDVGRTAAQVRYLDCLKELGPADRNQVAEYMDVTPQTAGEALRALADTGRALVVAEPRLSGKPRLLYSVASRAHARVGGHPSNPSIPSIDENGWGGTWWEER
jgi:hypothetical protein